MNWLKKQGKALAGLVVIVAGSLAAAASAGNVNLTDLSARDYLIAAGAALGSAAGTALITNVTGVAGGVAKAVWTAASAGIPVLLLAMENESALGATITQSEWVGAFIVAITATGVVYEKRDDPSVPPPSG